MIKEIKEIYNTENTYINKNITIKGWVKNHRRGKENGFIDISDGTSFKTLQVIYNNTLESFDSLDNLSIGSGISVEGILSLSPKEGQEFELVATKIQVLSLSSLDYPIQKRGQTRENLREIPHLRPRTNLFQAVFRIRSIAAFAVHSYFNERGYVYVNTPLITSNDGEGAGEMFNVTTLDLNKVPKNDKGEVDYKEDFFNEKVGLTVTGQLEGEAFALAFKKIYTFGPTFRAENSHTVKHASEFWMIEPEIMYADLDELMSIEEDMLKYIIKYVLDKASDEIEFLNKFVEVGLKERLEDVLKSNFVKLTHKEAIKILIESNKTFEVTPKYGEDLSTEHEKYLTEEKFNSPVFVYDWPKEIKAFYMKINPDNETVKGVDLLVPGSGELMGGSQREENAEVLQKRMKELNMNIDVLDWYLDLRRYGSVVHSGFGMGFERLIMYLTGVNNIRDVIPFPRTPNNCKY